MLHPQESLPVDFQREYLTTWFQKAEVREAVTMAWASIREELFERPLRTRWKHAQGPIAGVILTLSERGWGPLEADSWTAPTGEIWKWEPPTAGSPPCDLKPFLSALEKSIRDRLWIAAAQRWHGSGLQEGACVAQFRGKLLGSESRAVSRRRAS